MSRYKNNEKLYLKAFEKWGVYAQRQMCIEECSELINVLCKDGRGRTNNSNEILDELVDVYIMIEQMLCLYSIKKKDFVEHYNKKIKRLKERLK